MVLRLLFAAVISLTGLYGVPVEHFPSETFSQEDEADPVEQEGPHDLVYFPDTGQHLGGELFEFWLEYGGLPVFGFPVTEKIDQGDHSAQYFERAVLEFYPDEDPEWQVQLRRLGDEATSPSLKRNGAFAPSDDQRTLRYFPETSQVLSSRFYGHWRSHGGERIFGYPISSEFEANGKTFQYFERAVFQYHPESDADWRVLQPHLGAEAAAYEGVDMSPKPRLPGVPDFDPELFGRGGDGPAERVIYMTFDDGPHPTWTPQVLDILDDYGARGTFFVLGRYADMHPELIEQISDQGHALANHTYDHSSMKGMSRDQFEWQIRETERAVGPEIVPCMRPPYGAMDSNTKPWSEELGYEVILWDVDPNDWQRPGSDVIADRILRDVGPGDVVLLHDGGDDRQQSVDALEVVMKELDQKGYRFEAMCQ